MTQTPLEQIIREMQRYLPVLQALENEPEAWNACTQGTGIATLNGYKNALKEAAAMTEIAGKATTQGGGEEIEGKLTSG